jgi:hypothetical protein
MHAINQFYLKMYQQPQLLFTADLFENLTDYTELRNAIPASESPENTMELFRQTAKFVQEKFEAFIRQNNFVDRKVKSKAKVQLNCFRDTPALESLLGSLVRLNEYKEFNQSKDFQEFAGAMENDLLLLEASENPVKTLVECFGCFLLYNNQIWGKIYRSVRDQRRLPLMSLLIRVGLCQIP